MRIDNQFMRCLNYIDVKTWDTSSSEWHQLLLQIPDQEQKQVSRFVYAKDQKLALASRLLQRQLIHNLFGIKYDAINIARTPENKPYWSRPTHTSAPASWNFNVSHHGTIVAIASDSRALIGVDVVRLSDRPRSKTSIIDFFRAFEAHFSLREWDYIRGTAFPNTEDDQYARFYALWSLKEAFIKAIGIGLGYSLQRAEFIRTNSCQEDQWELFLDGKRSKDWQFRSKLVDTEHLVTLAYGPFSAMWKPETSSIFPGNSLFIEHSSTDTKTSPVWQQWGIKDLLQSIKSGKDASS